MQNMSRLERTKRETRVLLQYQYVIIGIIKVKPKSVDRYEKRIFNL